MHLDTHHTLDAERLNHQTRAWIKDAVVPLWSSRGLDRDYGGFFESLTFSGQPVVNVPKRSMVQARQIYTFRVLADLKMIPRGEATRAVESSADFLVRHAFRPNGMIVQSVDRRGSPADEMSDLYTQAFAIFGMANAFTLSPKKEYRERALGIVRYLRAERAVQAGGFTETKPNMATYQSNPHMHLFESMLAWMEIDPRESLWRELADEIFALCSTKFIEPRTRLLAEFFDETWNPILTAGKFVFEPGHQYEWAWLMKRYERLSGKRVGDLPMTLFKTGDEHGLFHPRGTANDEMWSDLTPKKRSSRFWPQTERIKAAMSLGQARAGDHALGVLFKYIETDIALPGLWWDTWAEDGKFSGDPVKSSSLYHIIGAMNEYLTVRAGI